MAFLPLGGHPVPAHADGMELLILIAIFVATGIASIAGWVPDNRTGRDWQPRGGWKPTEEVRGAGWHHRASH